jgi:3,4-dihydroxyphenylacetate 2,3-dioxygenase
MFARGWKTYTIAREAKELAMGEIVMAAKVTHVPSIWLSLQEGKHHGIRRKAELALIEIGRRARAAGADTFVVADTHWLNTSGFHLNAKARHEGTYASHELPHFIQGLKYAYPGAPDLGADIAREIASSGLKSYAHDIPELGLEYGTLVPMYLCNPASDAGDPLRVLPISTIDENIQVGRAIARAVRKSDHNVAFLASGSLSHDFPTNAETEMYLDKISKEFHGHMDHMVLEMWQGGRVDDFLDILPEYSRRCVGEGAMADTGMLFGILGARDYRGKGEVLCDWFPSTGTGQAVVDFSLPSATAG